MNRPITNEDFRLCKQRHIQIKLKLDIYDLHDNYVDTIVGGVVNGNASINADSDVRRTFSLTIIPDWKSRRFVDEQGYIWIDKMVHVSIGILDERTDEPYWWKFGKFIFTNTNTTYDATNNQLTINCSDLMSTLDGSKNGELGQLSILFPAYKEFRTTANDIYYCKIANNVNNTYKLTISGYNLYSNSDFIVAGLVGTNEDYPNLQINGLPPIPIVDKENRERLKAGTIKSGTIYSFFIDTNTAVLSLETPYSIAEHRKFTGSGICEYHLADHVEHFSISPSLSSGESIDGKWFLIDNINASGETYGHGDYAQVEIVDHEHPYGERYYAFEAFCYNEGNTRKISFRKITGSWTLYSGQIFSRGSLAYWLNNMDPNTSIIPESEIQYFRDLISESGDILCVTFFTNKEYDSKKNEYYWLNTSKNLSNIYEHDINYRTEQLYNLSYSFTVQSYNYYTANVSGMGYPQVTDCITLTINKQFKTVAGYPISISFGPYSYVDLVDDYGNELNPSAITDGERTYIFYVDYVYPGTGHGRAKIIPDYPLESDIPDGAPINYYTIRNAILTAVGQLAHIHKDECQVDEVGEYKALPIYNPQWEQYRLENPLWDNIPYDLEFAHGDTVLTILQKLRDLYPNYETYFDENGVFCCNMIPSGDEDPVIIPSDYYDDTIISENTSMDLTTVRNICHAWGQNIDAKFYSEDVTYNMTQGQDMSDCAKVIITMYDAGTRELFGTVKTGTIRDKVYYFMPMSVPWGSVAVQNTRYYFDYDSQDNLINIRPVDYTPTVTSSSSSGSSGGIGIDGGIDPGTGQIGGSYVPISASPSVGAMGMSARYPTFTITWLADGYTEKWSNYYASTPAFEANKTYLMYNKRTQTIQNESAITSSNENYTVLRWKSKMDGFSYPFNDVYYKALASITPKSADYNCISASIPSYDAYMTGDVIALKLPDFSGKSLSNPSLNINNLGYVPIYDENTYLPLQEDRLKPQVTYCFKIKKKRVDGKDTVSAYLLGSWQVQGIAALVDTRCKSGINPTDNPEDYYTTTDGIQVVRYSEEYFKAIYACPEVRLIVAPNSPFTCQRIGEVMSVYVDETNLTSDSLATSRADWEVYNKARLIDSISVTTKLSPFADVNIKVMYKRNDLGTVGYYIVKDVNHDLTNGTTTWQLMSFYPLYGSLNMTHGEIFENKYTHSQLSAYSHQNI